jgi:hypothetical protein
MMFYYQFQVMPLIVSVCERLSKPAHTFLPDLITRIVSADTDYELLYRNHCKSQTEAKTATHTGN